MVFSIHKNGKPYLCNNSEFHFNISHTRNAIAVAFSDNEIGVDVEPVQSVDLAISNRFFTSSEQDYISSHENSNHAFYEVCTKKEAYIKYTGSGLSAPLKSFNVLDSQIRSMLQTFEMKTYIISACCNNLIRIIKPIFICVTERELLLLFSKIT